MKRVLVGVGITLALLVVPGLLVFWSAGKPKRDVEASIHELRSARDERGQSDGTRYKRDSPLQAPAKGAADHSAPDPSHEELCAQPSALAEPRKVVAHALEGQTVSGEGGTVLPGLYHLKRVETFGVTRAGVLDERNAANVHAATFLLNKDGSGEAARRIGLATIWDYIDWNTEGKSFRLSGICHPGFSLTAEFTFVNDELSLRLRDNTWWYFKRGHPE